MAWTLRVQSLDSASQSFGGEASITPASPLVAKGISTVEDTEVNVVMTSVFPEFQGLMLKNTGLLNKIQVSLASIVGGSATVLEIPPGLSVAILVPAGYATQFFAQASAAGESENLQWEFRAP